MSKKLKVLIMFDAAEPIREGQDYGEVLNDPEKKAEAHVYETLLKLEHEVRLLAVTDSVEAIVDEIQAHRPDIVFNQVEQFCGNGTQERNVMGLLEMLQVPFTGTGLAGLLICKNKALAKEILSHHRIKTPNFQVLAKGKRVYAPRRLKYPLIIKPLREEASYGISMNSFVENDKDFFERVSFVQESMNQDVIAEEYVEGRELYVGILGNKRPQVLPARELDFGEMPEDGPKIATFKAKWDEKYREKWGIKNRFASRLSDEVQREIEKTCKKVFTYLYLGGYARLDLRLSPDNEVIVIEANPNPFVARDEDFALSAAKFGISYEELIQRILNYGLEPC